MKRRLAILVALALPTLALADEPAARRLFLEGNRLLEQQDFAGALERYDRAWAEYPNPRILINRATALTKMGRLHEAANSYAAYLRDPRAEASRMSAVRTELAALDARVGQLEIGVAEPGAMIVLDGVDLGPSPQELVLRVAPGRHELAARKSGYTPAQAQVTLAAGERRAVVLDLVPVPEAPSPTVVEIDPPDRPAPPPVRLQRRAARVPRLGLALGADVDGLFRGAAGTVGLAIRVGSMELGLAGVVGPNFGGKIAVTLPLGRGRWQPLLTATAPLYALDEGLVLGVGLGAGVRVRLAGNLTFGITVNGQLHAIRPEPVVPLMWTPSASVTYGI
jgi:PEGA domain/Tetratricopeptide repeat